MLILRFLIRLLRTRSWLGLTNLLRDWIRSLGLRFRGLVPSLGGSEVSSLPGLLVIRRFLL